MVRQDLSGFSPFGEARPEAFSARLAREIELARSPVVESLIARSACLAVFTEFRARLGELTGSGRGPGLAGIEGLALDFAGRLWSQAVRASASDEGDLPLYWVRLRMLGHLCGLPEFESSAGEAVLRTFDLISRNLSAAADAKNEPPTAGEGSAVGDGADAAERLVWITGFDPYGLVADRAETRANTNPSGAAALALHGRRVRGASGRNFGVRSAIFPVRFADFSEGLVESFLEERVLGRLDCEYCFTISMGGEADSFHIDRFPGNCRGQVPDNAGQVAGPAPILAAAAPPFVEHRMAPDALLRMQALGSEPENFAVRDQRRVVTVDRGTLEPAGAFGLRDLAGERAVRGSGGDYLSNEITYRVLHRLFRSERPDLSSAHIHTPRLADGGHAGEIEKRARIVGQIEAMLCAAV